MFAAMVATVAFFLDSFNKLLWLAATGNLYGDWPASSACASFALVRLMGELNVVKLPASLAT